MMHLLDRWRGSEVADRELLTLELPQGALLRRRDTAKISKENMNSSREIRNSDFEKSKLGRFSLFSFFCHRLTIIGYAMD